jgi:glycosyltransferase involved in cell wall biosynthesis
MWTSSYGQTAGGGPVLAPLLAGALAARGHGVHVLTDRRPESLAPVELRDGVHVHRPLFRRALAGDARLMHAVRREVTEVKRAADAEVYFIFSSGYGEFFHHVSASCRPAPLVVGLHDCFDARDYRAEAMVGRNVRAARRVIACSDAVLQTARRHVPILAPISTLIKNALPSPPVRAKARDAAHFRLGFVGRLVRQKGVDVLVAAMGLLAARHPLLELAVVGDGEQRDALEAQALELGLSRRIVFRGPLRHGDVYGFLRTIGALVVPSRREPFGLAALEAAQMGLPVIASDVDGLPEIVVNGRTGLLVKVGDPAALARAIESMLENPRRAAAWGDAARRRAATEFAWDGYVDAHERVLGALVSG